MPERSTWRCPPLLESAASTRHMSIDSPCAFKAVRGEALDQREADAIEQVRQIVAEIEMDAVVHRIGSLAQRVATATLTYLMHNQLLHLQQL